MFLTGRFYVDGKDYPMLRCRVQIPQKPIYKTGMVIGSSAAPQIHIAIESTSDTHLLHWINEQRSKDHVTLRFINYHKLGDDKVFDLYDVYCIRNEEYFWSDSSRPMTNTITLIPAIFIAKGAVPIILPWHKQDPKTILNASYNNATQGTVEGKVSDCYFEDSEGNKLTKVKVDQNIYVVVNSTNMVGNVISVDLSDDKVDYEYNGQYLDSDLLENINVTADKMRVALKTLKQRN